jgi:outer membrane protein OmpA-like peptidoglycan-associated protein
MKMNRPWIPAIVVAFLLTGCSSLSHVVGAQTVAALSCAPSQGVILIIGAHRNAPAPSLDQRLACQVTGAIHDGKPVFLVVASGQPELITPRLVSVKGGTLAQQGSPRVQEDLQRINDAIANTRPGSPGVDDLAALSVAADAARSAGAPHAELVLLDSGLDDRGALDFTVPGMVAAIPSEVASQLWASNNQPDLRGFTVLLVSIGYTSPPQAPLPAKWRSNVTQIWNRVVTSAGARAEIVPQPAQGASVKTNQPVKLVPVPTDQAVKPTPRTPIVFTGESPVRFEPDSTAFADPAAAVRALTPIVQWLASDPSRHASLVGTTADVGSMPGQVMLSKQRADRVREELVTLGASPRQISSTGAGSDFAEFTPDRDSSGTLFAGPAILNRSVRITVSGS